MCFFGIPIAYGYDKLLEGEEIDITTGDEFEDDRQGTLVSDRTGLGPDDLAGSAASA